MASFSLSPVDIQNLFFVLYGVSLLEVSPAMLEHFVKKAIPHLHGKTTKDIRKSLRKALGEISLASYRYKDGDQKLEYPWMFNPKPIQLKLVASIEEDKVKSKR